MSYQVIARKYRPQRFSDVVGQEHVTQTLAQAIAQGRIAHAYLFCGPRGTGKTTIARIFAKCLNCTGGPKVDFEEQDPKCVEITEGRSIDVLEIDGASNNGVDQVRELRDTARYAPASSKFKVYIIDEVHMLTTQAFNALLKTLEEPPAHVKFMFATTDPEKVLPTILSRCQRFDLRRIPVALIVKQLKHIAKEEGVTVEDAALHAIARGCDGGMRDAESALDQLISFCGNQIVETDVLSMYGLMAQTQLLALTQAIITGDTATALRELDTLAKQGKDLGRLISDLLRHFRNLLIHQVAPGDQSLLEASEAETAVLAQQSASLPSEALTRIMEVLSDCEMNLRDAASKKILIEVAMLKAIQARNAVSLDAVLKQLQQLRAEGGGATNTAPAPTAPSTAATPAAFASLRQAMAAPTTSRPVAPAPAPVIAPAVVPPTPSAPVAPVPAAKPVHQLSPEEMENLYARVVEAAGRASPFVKSYLQEAFPVSFEKGTFTIGFPPVVREHLDLVNNTKNHTLLQGKFKELGLGHVFIKFVVAEEPANRPKPAPAATANQAGQNPSGTPANDHGKPPEFDPLTFKNDPMIQKALEIFKGTLVRQ
ncbi:MAG: DNA polymerase III subunit gamma/tau [Verrucomicrobiota bacterium]